MNQEFPICNECESEYLAGSSKMSGLCIECAHQLYGYKNCDHDFKNGRCLKCFWNGNVSEYLRNRQ